METTIQVNGEEVLRQKMEAYYTAYYRDALGLPDWKKRLEPRHEEEETLGRTVVEWVERWIDYSFAKKEVLVVGAGTGAETFVLEQKGANVLPLEPYRPGAEIIAAKAKYKFHTRNKVCQAVGEALPLRDDLFDFVLCYTVIEHVQDPVRCIAEMVRVLKPGGWLFIFTPDYRHTYEQHYKKHLPIWAPMWLIKLWLRWQGRPASFFDSIQRVNSWQISRILQEHPVTSFYVVPAWTEAQKKDRTWGGRLERWLTRRFGFQRNQRWLVRKEGGA